jgi:hypothetical protein
VLQNNLSSRATYTAFRACVVAASISVATEAIRRFKQVKNHSSRDVRLLSLSLSSILSRPS